MVRTSTTAAGRGRWRLAALLAVVLLGGAAPVGAEVFCNSSGFDPRVPMPATTALPFGAVGYLDNGCTATLVSERHIVTAAHCLARSWSDGSWMPVYFVPNFNTATTPTFVEVDRGVVGRRTDSMGDARLDWAIGHLAQPVTNFPRMVIAPEQPATPYQVVNAGYGRDLNRVSPRTRPAGAPCLNEFCTNGGNVWWDNALVHYNCSVLSNDDDLALTDCAVVGGNSGSPLFRGVPAGGRKVEYQVTGVISGGAAAFEYSTVKTLDDPTKPNRRCVRRRSTSKLNGGPASPEFKYAPYFATGAAVVPNHAKSKTSLVVAADGDASRFVARERSGSKITDAFGDYGFFGFLLRPTHLTSFLQPGGAPGLAAIANKGRLFVRLADKDGEWDHWRPLDLPPGVAKLVDVDGLEGGTGELYAVGSDGRAFHRAFVGSGWKSWKTLPGGGYRAISAARRANGGRFVFLLTTAGAVKWTKATSAGAFTSPVAFAGSTFPKLAEVDAVTDHDGAVRVFAVTTTGALRTRQTVGKTTDWLDWELWRVRLYTPPVADESKASSAAKKYGFWQETTGPALDRVSSLTATRWREPGTSSASNTVVLATDTRGNLYSTGYRCAGSAKPASCYWAGWRTFTE